jgi:hypothetical protein
VRDESNAVAIESGTDAAAPASNGRAFVDMPFDLPIARLRPGRYLLSADVQDGTHAAHATMRFSVTEPAAPTASAR